MARSKGLRPGEVLLHPVVRVEIEGELRTIYGLQPKQMEAYNLTPLVRGVIGPRHIGYGGAAGGAKSHTARGIATAVAMAWPGSTTIIFRRTRPEVVNNHWNKFLEEVPYEGTLYTKNASELVVHWFNGSRTMFGYLERDDHVYRYQGVEYDCMIFEEATHYSWFQVNWLTSNRLRSSVPGTIPFSVYLTNPGGKGHYWFKRLFIEKKYDTARGERPENYAFIQSFVYDNRILCQRDPDYVRKLENQPEPYRSWFLLGDWEAGAGLALDMNAGVHLLEPFELPASWPLFRAFDWGFRHPFSFGWYATDEEGGLYKVDTIHGRNLHDPEILERIHEREAVLAQTTLKHHSGRHGGRISPKYTVAGLDCWNDIRSKVENLPTTAETFGRGKVPLTEASVSRISGLKNLREYTRWRSGGKPLATPPRFRLLRTDGNLWTYETLASMPTDPDEPEDALKTDADEYGEGGDDAYDETRYGAASRPINAPAPKQKPPPAAEHHDEQYSKRIKQLQTNLQKARGRSVLPK